MRISTRKAGESFAAAGFFAHWPTGCAHGRIRLWSSPKSLSKCAPSFRLRSRLTRAAAARRRTTTRTSLRFRINDLRAIEIQLSQESVSDLYLDGITCGDLIELDVPNRRLHLYVSEAELARRRASWQPPAPAYRRGYGQLYLQHVTQAPEGVDFDFLRGQDPVRITVQPKF